MEATGEKKPARGGVDAVQLEAMADEMARRARSAFQTAGHEEPGSFGRRFIEHGAMCYFNCWAMLREYLDAACPPPSATPEAE